MRIFIQNEMIEREKSTQSDQYTRYKYGKDKP